MTRKPTRRIEFTVPEHIGEQYDTARGDMPMATWLKRLAQDELGRTLNWNVDPPTSKRSADAKRAVRPIPEGKR